MLYMIDNIQLLALGHKMDEVMLSIADIPLTYENLLYDLQARSTPPLKYSGAHPEYSLAIELH